jgi:hypothetical protein
MNHVIYLKLRPSLNTQSCIRRPLCSTFRFENPRSPEKNEFFHVFGVKKFFFKLHPDNMKKMPSKVAHNRPPNFFSILARLTKRPENRNPVPPKAPYCRTGYLDWELRQK